MPCGEPVAAYLPATAGPVTGLSLGGPGDAGQLREEGGGALWHHPGPGSPGVYRVTRGDDVVFAVASALPAEEADLRPLDPAVLPERLGAGRAVSFRSVAGAVVPGLLGRESGSSSTWRPPSTVWRDGSAGGRTPSHSQINCAKLVS